jgi:hypothetical protein
MRVIGQVGIFGIAVIVGWILGGYAPKSSIPDSWRLPIAATLVGIGIALALMSFQ